MQDPLSRSSIWAIESNSFSNSANTPKRSFCRNYIEQKVVITSLNLLQKPAGLGAQICGRSPKSQALLYKKIKRNKRTFFSIFGGLNRLAFVDKPSDRTFTSSKKVSIRAAMRELLTLREVERELKISRTTVWRLRKLGLLKTSAFGGIIRIHRRDLERFVANELMAGRSR
jgi:hypothetical protein